MYFAMTITLPVSICHRSTLHTPPTYENGSGLLVWKQKTTVPDTATR